MGRGREGSKQLLRDYEDKTETVAEHSLETVSNGKPGPLEEEAAEAGQGRGKSKGSESILIEGGESNGVANDVLREESRRAAKRRGRRVVGPVSATVERGGVLVICARDELRGTETACVRCGGVRGPHSRVAARAGERGGGGGGGASWSEEDSRGGERARGARGGEERESEEEAACGGGGTGGGGGGAGEGAGGGIISAIYLRPAMRCPVLT